MSRSITAGGFLAPVSERERSLVRLVLFVLLGAALALVAAVAAIIPLQMVDPSILDEVNLALEGGGFPQGPGRLLDESRLMLVLALSLGAPALGLLLAARIVYRRPAASFLWPGRRFSPVLLLGGLAAMAALLLAAGLVGQRFGFEVRFPAFDPAYPADHRWIYALSAAALLLVAAAAEEVVCRGLLLQITAGFTRSAWILCLVNGVVFAALHLDPDPVAFVGRALSGALWAWAALRLGGLEFAIGAHWANNLMIALFAQPFSSAAQVDQGFSVESLAFDAGVSLGLLLLVEAWARRRARRASAA